MPELPEVETVVRDLRDSRLAGATITACSLPWPKTAGATPAEKFAAALRGRTISAITRRAKYIVLELDGGGVLLIHLRMTGKLRLDAAGAPHLPHDRLCLALDDGRTLVLNDTRKFARAQLADSVAGALADIGPEPLDPAFTPAILAAAIQGRKRNIKATLLDQTVVAGIGNIYADESLFAAGIHPERPAGSLTAGEIGRLHAAIQASLKKGIASNGTTLGRASTNFYSVAGRRGGNDANLQVFRRDGLPCPRCQTEIVRSIVAGRGTHFCPQCQPPVPLRGAPRPVSAQS